MKNLMLIFSMTLVGLWGCSQKAETTDGDAEIQTEESAEAVETVVEGGVSFVSPEDGATVTSPLKVEMGVSGMKVEPAGEIHEGMGHHHIIIDGSFIEKGVVVPADATHLHFGKGQTETTLELAPGAHTITLQFADGLHQSYGEQWSKTIQVTVE